MNRSDIAHDNKVFLCTFFTTKAYKYLVFLLLLLDCVPPDYYQMVHNDSLSCKITFTDFYSHIPQNDFCFKKLFLVNIISQTSIIFYILSSQASMEKFSKPLHIPNYILLLLYQIQSLPTKNYF